jgi:DNA-binding winged helix-turn-helix (wHTH) protein/tetratricopeptide (TPR) repeat protein
MSTIRFAGYVFEPEAGALSDGAITHKLRPKTAQLLQYFLSHPQQVLSRDMIFDDVWSDRIVTDNTLMQSVRELRAAFGDSAATPVHIETIHGRGYRWIGPAPDLTDETPANTPSGDMMTGRDPWQAVRAWALAILIGALISIAVLVLALFSAPEPATTAETDIRAAQSARSAGRSDLAEQYLEAALLREPGNAIAHVGLATILYERGDWDRALELAISGVGSPQPLSALQIAELHIVAGRILGSRGDLGASEVHFDAARSRPGSAAFSAVIHAAALEGLSQTYADQGRIADYMAVRTSAVDPLLMTAQVESYAEGLLSAGTMVQPSLNESWSLEHLQRALSVFEELADVGGIARSHQALGANRALPVDAREQHLERALAHYVEAGHIPGEINVLRSIASLETERFSSVAALQALDAARMIAARLQAHRMIAAIEYGRGLALLAAGSEPAGEALEQRLLQAEQAFLGSIDAYDEMGVVFDAIAPGLHLATVRLQAGRPEQALIGFQEAANRFGAVSFLLGEAGARVGEAFALHALDRSAEALALLASLEQTHPSTAPVVARARAFILDGQNHQSAEAGIAYFALAITAEQVMAEAG